MAKKQLVGELSDEEILRIARVRQTESAASTFSQTSIDTQLSVERGVIWMIHFVEFNFESLANFREVAANANEFFSAQLTRESKSGILNSDDSDLLQQQTLEAFRSAAIGTDAGPLWSMFPRVYRFDYPTPIPYASQSLFFSILGSSSGAAGTVGCRVGYTIRQVSDKYFFRVAQALLG